MTTIKRNIRPKIPRILKWLRCGIFAATLVAIVILFRRFEVMKVPSYCKLIPAGSYILVDWQFQKGRKLISGDCIFYSSGSKLILGKILATPGVSVWVRADKIELAGDTGKDSEKKDATYFQVPEKHYIIQPEKADTSWCLEPAASVKGRVLTAFGDN